MIWDGTEQTIPFGPRTGETLDSAFILLDGHLELVDDRDADAGEVTYQATCAGCHGVDGVGGALSGPRLEAVPGPCMGRIEPLDRAWFALGATGAELAVVTAHDGIHAVRGIEGHGGRMTLNDAPLDGVERPLAAGDRLRVGDGTWLFHAD